LLHTHASDSAIYKTLDAIAPYWRDKLFWVPLYIFTAAVLLINFGRKGLLALLFILFTVGLTDIVASKIIKPLVQRERPCRHAAELNYKELVVCGTGYSFPSAHAANHFAMAFITSFIFKRRRNFWKYALFLWAASIALAQVYVGVHYPVDIFFGAILGCIIAFAMSRLYQKAEMRGMTFL
jgi:membrane-associated phospholipid phosphatase